MWEDFINFYTHINFIITLLEHALATFSNLLHFLDSWVIYKNRRHIINGAKMHTIEFLQTRTKKNQKMMNLIVLQR